MIDYNSEQDNYRLGLELVTRQDALHARGRLSLLSPFSYKKLEALESILPRLHHYEATSERVALQGDIRLFLLDRIQSPTQIFTANYWGSLLKVVFMDQSIGYQKSTAEALKEAYDTSRFNRPAIADVLQFMQDYNPATIEYISNPL